jgi:DeoR/GlpR family transcriptional regulator of sugar metabolism
MNIRQRELKNRIYASGHIDINNEAEYFAVSEMRIRRDIVFLVALAY